ncbi:hypothetical protein RKLH11_3932 [Rhodobacteraceae bacterium KLH11]|nr:hypothetical protein RKLH11_3932 [Rhodobacteraceae bacterium KLH11]
MYPATFDQCSIPRPEVEGVSIKSFAPGVIVTIRKNEEEAPDLYFPAAQQKCREHLWS